MLLHFLELTKLRYHFHAPSSAGLWAANHQEHGLPLGFRCTVGSEAREEGND